MPAAKETSLNSPRRVAVLAGSGDLPRMLALRLRVQGYEPFIVAFKDHTDPRAVEGFEHEWFRLGATSRIFRGLRDRGLKDIVLIGAIRRPSLKDLRPDWKTAEFFMKYAAHTLGDDGLLRALRQFLEHEGFVLHGVHKFLPDLLAPRGVLGGVRPSAQDEKDIARGVEILRATAPLDIGQSVIVQQGFVLGLEAAEGTDELLRRCASLRRAGDRGVLVKLCKATQDRDLDLPTIGPDTIENVFDCGLSGVAVQTGAALIVDYERVIRIADAHKIFMIGVDEPV